MVLDEPFWAYVGIGAAACVCLAIFAMLRRMITGQSRSGEALDAVSRLEQSLANQQHFQADLAGRLQMLTEVFASRQNDLAQTLTARVDGLSHNLGQSVRLQAQVTSEQIAKVSERLAVIDEAQVVVGDLNQQVHGLTALLGDKQSRGLFGQGRMEAILGDCLPPGSFRLQPILSTGVKPDALVLLPKPMPPLVIDAKFPLEAFERWQGAHTDEKKKQSERAIRRDILKHVGDIHDRYLIAGETHDTALMFLPAESLYATLHEHFADVVQKALRLRVILVSPTSMMLAIQVLQNLLRDYRVSETVTELRTEMDVLSDNVVTLLSQINKLKADYDRLGTDLNQVFKTAEAISSRKDVISNLQVQGAGSCSADLNAHAAPGPHASLAAAASSRNSAAG